MLINVTETLKQFDGTPIKDVVKGEAVDATVRQAIVNALMSPAEKDTGLEKVKKYDLAMRVYKEDEVEFSAEEAAMVKEVVGKLFAPIVVGQLFKLLDGIK